MARNNKDRHNHYNPLGFPTPTVRIPAHQLRWLREEYDGTDETLVATAAQLRVYDDATVALGNEAYNPALARHIDGAFRADMVRKQVEKSPHISKIPDSVERRIQRQMKGHN